MLQSLLDQNLLLPCLALAAFVLALVSLRMGWVLKAWFAKRRETVLKSELRDAKAQAPNLASTLRQREETIHQLQDDNRDLRAGLGNVQREKNELERKLQMAHARVNHLSEEVSVLRGNSTLANASGDLSWVDADAGNSAEPASHQDPAENQRRLAHAESAYLKLQNALAEKSTKISALERDLEAARISTAGLTRVQYDAMGEALKRAEDTIADQAQRLTSLEEQKTTLEGLAERRSRTNHTVREAEREAQERARKLESELEDTVKTLAAREASIHRLFQELRDSQDMLRDTREKNDGLQGELSLRDQSLTELQRLLSDLQRQAQQETDIRRSATLAPAAEKGGATPAPP